VQESKFDDPREYWFNMKSNQVEVGKLSPASYRVGPFKTRLEAENALRTLRQKSATWAAEDSERD
jgi:hypothetical protein